MAGASVPLDVVKKWAPAGKFHSSERQRPCSIEHLLEGATLNMRTWRPAQQIPLNQQTGTPSAAVLQEKLWIVSVAQDPSCQLYCSSFNGDSWEGPWSIDGQSAHANDSTIGMAVFQDKLWIVYAGRDSNEQLYSSCSSDGRKWEYRAIAGQGAFHPSITVYHGSLWMVYSSTSDSTTYQSQSQNGWDWTGPKPIDPDSTKFDKASLITFKDKMLFVNGGGSGGHGSDLYAAVYNPESDSWDSHRIEGQQAYRVAMAVCQDWLVMTYSDNHSSQFYCSRSQDGVNWQDTEQIPEQNGSETAMAIYRDRAYLIYAGTERSGRLYFSSIPTDRQYIGWPSIQNPTQKDLQTYSGEDYYVKVADSQFGGQSFPQAPLYYAVQNYTDASSGKKYMLIHYLFLYAFQAGQTVRALEPGAEFNCIIFSLGEHQGDLERYMVTLDENYQLVSSEFEAHGNKTTWMPDQVEWEEGTHAVLSIALNNHSVWNPKQVSNPDWDVYVAGAVGIGNFFDDDSSAQWWRPWKEGSEFRLLGLTSDGQPVNDQVWAAFGGRLGDSYGTSLRGAVYFDGGNLSFWDWDFVKLIGWGASILNKLPTDIQNADGPRGPAARDWVMPTK